MPVKRRLRVLKEVLRLIDEAHKLSYLGSALSLGYERIGVKMCGNRARHCLLLTITPRRGKTDNFMARIGFSGSPTPVGMFTSTGALIKSF